jgi:hypothetical protein
LLRGEYKVIELIRVFRRARYIGICGLVAAALLAGCGGDATNGADAMEGKFFYAMPTSPGQGMTLELMKDWTAIGTRPGGRVQPGTYRRDGNKVIVSLTGDGANLTYTLQDDGNLTTIFYGNETAVFVKQ